MCAIYEVATRFSGDVELNVRSGTDVYTCALGAFAVHRDETMCPLQLSAQLHYAHRKYE